MNILSPLFHADAEASTAALAIAKIIRPLDADRGHPARERAAVKTAMTALGAAQENFAEVAKKSRMPAGAADPERDLAQREVERAQRVLDEARKVLAAARQRRDAEFVRRTLAQLDEAAPLVADLVRNIEPAVGALHGALAHAAVNGLPCPRALADAAAVREGLLALRRIANRHLPVEEKAS